MTKRNNVVPLSEVIRLYLDEKWPAQRIADRYGLNYQTILRWLDDAGVSRRTCGNHSTAILDRDILTRLYVKEQRTIEEIAKGLGCSLGLVVKCMRKFGIQPRSKGYYQQQLSARRRLGK
jgi:transposase-like protein